MTSRNIEPDDFINDHAPDREWRIISSYVESGKYPAFDQENPDYRKAYNFLRRLHGAPSQADHRHLRKNYPALYKAYAMREVTTSCRWLVEAGILANAPHPIIAEYIGSDAETTETYEKFFYNIRPFLSRRGFIQNLVFFPVQKGASSNDCEFMYKIVAYYGGWSMFTSFMETGALSPDVEKWIVRTSTDRLKKVGWTALQGISPNEENSVDLIGKFLELVKAEKESLGPRLDEKATEIMKSLFGSGCLSVAPSGKELDPDESRALDLVQPYRGLFSPGEPKNGDRKTQ